MFQVQLCFPFMWVCNRQWFFMEWPFKKRQNNREWLQRLSNSLNKPIIIKMSSSFTNFCCIVFQRLEAGLRKERNTYILTPSWLRCLPALPGGAPPPQAFPSNVRPEWIASSSLPALCLKYSRNGTKYFGCHGTFL